MKEIDTEDQKDGKRNTQSKRQRMKKGQEVNNSKIDTEKTI